MSSSVETPSRRLEVREETEPLTPTMIQEAPQTISAVEEQESELAPTIQAGLESVAATAAPYVQLPSAVPAVQAVPALVQIQSTIPTLSQQVVDPAVKKQFKLKTTAKTYPKPMNSLMNRPIAGLNRLPDEDGLYPDIEDKTFLAKLLAKREFRESLQPKITDDLLKENENLSNENKRNKKINTETK